MRRIGRYILNGVTVLSLVLCVATIGLWVRSYYIADVFEHAHEWRIEDSPSYIYWTDLRMTSYRGRCMALWTGRIAAPDYVLTDTPLSGWSHDPRHVTELDDTAWQRLGLFYVRSRPLQLAPINLVPYSGVGTPYCFLTLLFVALPLVRFTPWHRHWNAGDAGDAGHCSKCNYDLRATRDRCPEYGTIPTKVKA